MTRGIGNGVDTYADSTLMTCNKVELIRIIRTLEKNLRNAEFRNDEQYKILTKLTDYICKYEERYQCICEEVWERESVKEEDSWCANNCNEFNARCLMKWLKGAE